MSYSHDGNDPDRFGNGGAGTARPSSSDGAVGAFLGGLIIGALLGAAIASSRNDNPHVTPALPPALPPPPVPPLLPPSPPAFFRLEEPQVAVAPESYRRRSVWDLKALALILLGGIGMILTVAYVLATEGP